MVDEKTKHFLVSVTLLCVVLGTLLFVGLGMETQQHEEAHAQICKYVGGVPNITYTDFGTDGATRCTGQNNTLLLLSENDYRMKISLDSMNESVEYQLFPLFFLLTSFSIVICIFLLGIIEFRVR